MSNFNPRETMFAAADAISLRLGGHPPCPHPLADVLTLRDIAKAAGVMIRPDMDIDDPRAEGVGVVQGEFATKLAAGVEKAARDAFALQRQHAGFLTEVGVRDFKPAQQESMDGNAALELTKQNIEIQRGRCKLSESVGTAALQSYAKILTLSREAIINDTLGGFSRATWQTGASAAQIEAGLIAAQLEANPALPDGGVTFDASFGNVTAELLGGGLGAGMALLRQQNSGHGVMTNAAAKFIVCSPELELTALGLVADNRLPVTVVALPGLPVARWYLLGDARLFPCVGYLKLENFPQLRVAVDSRNGTAIAVRVIAELGIQIVSRVGIVRGGV